MTNVSEYKKSVGLALCGLFLASTLSIIFSFICNWAGLYYNPYITGVIYMIFSLTISGATLIAAVNGKAFNNTLGRVMAFVGAALYTLLAIDNICSIAGFSIFSFLGYSTRTLVIDIIVAAVFIPYLFSLRTLAATKIIGAVIFFLGIVSGVFFYSFVASGDYMYLTGISIVSVICLLLHITALILTLVWMAKRQEPIR